MIKMFFSVFCLIASLPLLLFEALFYLPLLLRQLWNKWQYTALTLREPPPPGGMFGTMVRRLKDKRSAAADHE